MTAVLRSSLVRQPVEPEGAGGEPGALASGNAGAHWAAVATLAVATLIVGSESTMAAFALPLVRNDFGVAASSSAWLLLAYSLPLAALAIPAGRWVDRADVRLVFVVSLIGVGATSLLAALAPSFWLLLAGRLLQGVASAAYLAVYLPIVAVAVPEAQRGRAMSAISAIMLVGSLALAPLGGYVAAAYGWRAVFLVKFPFLLIAAWLGALCIPATRPGARNGRRLPLPDRALLAEALLIGGAVAAGLLAFEQVRVQPTTAAALGVVAAAMGAWWAWLPASEPVIDLLRRRAFGLPVLALLLVASSIGLIVFSLPFFIGDVMGQRPELLGLAIGVFVAAAAVVTPLAGALIDRHGPLRVAAIGGALAATAMLTMSSLNAEANLTDLAWRMAALGVGMALFNSPTMTAILNATPAGSAGTAGGITNIARTLANTVGPAVAALSWSLGGGGAAGFRAGAFVLSTFALAGVLALLAARGRDS